MDFSAGSLKLTLKGNRLLPGNSIIARIARKSLQLNNDSPAIFFLGLIIFTISLQPEFISLQCRFALFAQEMFNNGPSFFPTIYRVPYPDYPATSTLLIYLFSLLFGKVTPFSAVLPTALASALILVVTYKIGAIRSRKWGLLSVMFLLSTHLFFSEARVISPDQFVSLATVLCFYVIYSADVFGREKRLWFIPLLLAAGFSFRGPIGLIIPASVVCSYYLWCREFKKLTLMALAALGVMILCSAALLAAADFQGGKEFVRKVIYSQAIGRVTESNKIHLFYWLACLYSCAIGYPLAIVITFAGFKNIVKKKNDNYVLIGCLLSWILVVLIGMSIPATKHLRYVLPIVPAISLIAAYLFVDSSPKGILFETRNILVSVCYHLPRLATLATLFLLIFCRYFGFPVDVHYIVALILLIGLNIIIRTQKQKLKAGFKHNIAFLLTGVAVLITVNIGIAEPVSLTLESTRPFVEKMKSLQNERPGQVVFYQIGPDGEDIKFAANYNRPTKPLFIKNSEDILQQSPQTYFVSRQKAFNNLPEKIAQKTHVEFYGKIGHKDCVIFSRKLDSG